MRELPALLIVGPRATGKTTTALRHAATTVRLDQPAQAAAFLADPDAALRGLEEPVLLDEWQVVPEVLGAVKRSVDMLINLRVAEAVASWTSNRLKRLVQAPKRYLVDPALLAGVLRVDAAGVMRDGNLLGRVLDTFVAAQLRAQLPVAQSRPRLYHLRDAQGRHEVDLLGELGGQHVVAIEVKADAAPRPDAAKHLRWLQDRLEDRFTAGIILHTGPRSYEIDDRIIAAPISTLWA